MTDFESSPQKQKSSSFSIRYAAGFITFLVGLRLIPTSIPKIESASNLFSFSAGQRSSLGDIARFLPEQAIAAVPTQPIRMVRRQVGSIRLYLTIIDLRDPNVLLHIGLPYNAAQANSSKYSSGVEPFSRFVARQPAAVMINGTFFSTDAQKRVMGNMVAGGKVLKFSSAENYGTTLGFLKGNRLEMVTARADGKPDWNQHWFSMTAGPRLLRQGSFWINPRTEGFRDSNVMGVAKRNAIGFSKSNKTLFLATFTTPITLQQEARIMKSIGCYEAMNLDGGSSTALAYRGKILVKPRRSLTNVLMVYDASHPAPQSLRSSWNQFQGSSSTAYNR